MTLEDVDRISNSIDRAAAEIRANTKIAKKIKKLSAYEILIFLLSKQAEIGGENSESRNTKKA